MKLNLPILFKNLFVFSLIWILAEGIFRKWFFLSLAGPLFYVKYLLFGLLYLIFILGKFPIPKVKSFYQYLILLFLIICCIGFFINKNNNPIIVGIIGIVVHLVFLPLTQITQFLFKELKTITLLAKIITYITIPICLLGIIQFYLPTDHILNGFVNEEQNVARISGFTRISSIFPFVKIYNAYLLFTITFLTSYIIIKLLQGKKIILETSVITLIVINMFMTGSRLSIGLMLLNVLIIGVYVFLNFSNLRKTVLIVSIMGFISLSLLYTTTNILNDPIDATLDRIEKVEARHREESTGYTDVKLRMEDRLDIFKFSAEAGWFGYGIGMAYQGSQGFIQHPIPFYFEEEGERLVLELGVIGAIIILLTRLGLFILSVQILRWCKSIELKLFLLPLALYLLPSIFTIQNTTYSYLENFIYYFTFGLIIALYKIHQKELNKPS